MIEPTPQQPTEIKCWHCGEIQRVEPHEVEVNQVRCVCGALTELQPTTSGNLDEAIHINRACPVDCIGSEAAIKAAGYMTLDDVVQMIEEIGNPIKVSNVMPIALHDQRAMEHHGAEVMRRAILKLLGGE